MQGLQGRDTLNQAGKIYLTLGEEMAIIRTSEKLKSEKAQSKIVAGGYVILRVLRNADDTYRVMTATAGEDDKSHAAFPNTQLLLKIADMVYRPIAERVVTNADHSNRPYLEFLRVDDPKALQDAGNRLAQLLGLDPATCAWIDAEAREEGKELWNEFSVDDEGDAYMMDKATMSKSGRFHGGNS
jgi:hypothetical protein